MICMAWRVFMRDCIFQFTCKGPVGLAQNPSVAIYAFVSSRFYHIYNQFVYDLVN